VTTRFVTLLGRHVQNFLGNFLSLKCLRKTAEFSNLLKKVYRKPERAIRNRRQHLLLLWDYLPLTISCSNKSRLVLLFLVLPFWNLLTRVVLDKFQRSSKTIVCVCVWLFVNATPWKRLYFLMIFNVICAGINHTKLWLDELMDANFRKEVVLSHYYTVVHKKWDTFIFSITLANIDRFS